MDKQQNKRVAIDVDEKDKVPVPFDKQDTLDWYKKRLETSELTNEKNAIVVSTIFRDVRVYFDGVTEVSLIHLKKLVLSHSGTHSHFFSASRVTHIIGTALSLPKMQAIQKRQASKNQRHIHYVHSDWILDSCKQVRRLPESSYSLVKPCQKGASDIRSFFQSTRDSPPAAPSPYTSLDYQTLNDLDEYALVTHLKKKRHGQLGTDDDSEVDFEQMFYCPKLSAVDYIHGHRHKKDDGDGADLEDHSSSSSSSEEEQEVLDKPPTFVKALPRGQAKDLLE
eukprot:gene12153-14220_t